MNRLELLGNLTFLDRKDIVFLINIVINYTLTMNFVIMECTNQDISLFEKH